MNDLDRAQVFIASIRDTRIKTAIERAIEPLERAKYAGQLLRAGIPVLTVKGRIQARYGVSRATAYFDIAVAQDSGPF